jgi:flagellar biosynthetic protein FlhB
MGLFGDDQGKTEKPTPGRLVEVRNRGDSPLSRELVQGGVLLLAAILLLWLGGWLIESFGQVMRFGFNLDMRDRQLDQVGGACAELWRAAMVIVPPFAVLVLVLFVAAASIGYGQIGFKWSREAVGFKIEKLNPFTNFKRFVSLQSLVRTGFAIIKLAIIVAVLWVVLASRLPILLHLHELPFAAAAGEIGDLTLTLLLWIGAIVTAIACVDLAWQRFDFTKRNMMTRQEVTDERKRSEGDPTMKARQRSARNELLRQRMMAEIPRADVVIINPTHFSVALRYDKQRAPAPIVVAKGVDEMALKIRALARESNVPLMEDPPLARALYRAVKVGQSVPEKFYQAVATVLGHVYRLKGRTA